MKKIIIFTGLFLCFSFGAFAWKVLNTSNHFSQDASSYGQLQRRSKQAVLVEIEGSPITKSDVQFEYDLLTNELKEKQSDMVPASSLDSNLDVELGSLKDNIINSLVERKMLYQLVRQDKNFDLSSKSRYESCLKQWNETLAEKIAFFAAQENQERLKARLCEQNILQQYLEEKVYAKIKIEEQRLLDAYNNHSDYLHSPDLVQIRQIVLADEDQARKVAGQVNHQNFASLARQYSITPDAEQGGLLPPFAMGGGMPRFFDVAFSMRSGQISAILKSTYGFHLIMLEKKIKERTLSYKEAVPYIQKHLLEMEKERAYQQWVDLALHTVKVSTPKLKR